jgi:predicted permease
MQSAHRRVIAESWERRASDLPLRSPEQLVILSNPDESGSWNGRWNGRTGGPRSWLTYGEFEQLRDQATSFSTVMASQSSLQTWRIRFEGDEWEEAHGRLVSGGFFETLGVAPAIGRLFTAADDRAAAFSAVISCDYWQRRFGGRPDVPGKRLIIRSTPLTIIGVAPCGFIGETVGQRPDLWLPITAQPSVLPGQDRLHDTPPEKTMWLHVFGRLKPGAIFRAGLESFYGTHASGARRHEFLDQRLQLRPGGRGASPARANFALSLTALLAAVAVLLVIACANLANLLMARAAARRSEMALRLSLGASRGRIVRQLVTESVSLAAFGGAAAVAVSTMLHSALVQMLAESDDRFHVSFSLDPLVATFVITTAFATAVLFGGLPAWQASRSEPAASLREQGRGAAGSIGLIRSGRCLVGLQLALSLPLLVGAGLLARTAWNLQRADLGFPPKRLVLTRVNLREAAEDPIGRERLRRQLQARLQQIPGVTAVSYSQLGLFTGGESSNSIEVEGYTPAGEFDRGSGVDAVGPGYFSTLGVPITLGREILARDFGDAPAVCVINEAFARRFFERRDPIGFHITAVGDTTRTACEVIGVTGNTRTQTLRGDVAPRYFVTARPGSTSADSPTYLIRTAAENTAIVAEVRTVLHRESPSVTILSATSLDEAMAPVTAQDRVVARLAAVFGAVALALAAIGLYGVLSYGIACRTGEIAIRLALGARPAGVVSMILRDSLGLVVAGLVLGAALAYAALRLIGSRLYGVAPQDPLTLSLATGLLLVVAFAAAYLPARRAARLDPVTALR